MSPRASKPFVSPPMLRADIELAEAERRLVYAVDARAVAHISDGLVSLCGYGPLVGASATGHASLEPLLVCWSCSSRYKAALGEPPPADFG